SSRRRHTRSKRDWSSDVCSSDLVLATRSVGGCRLLGIMHLGWCPRVSLFELVLGRMARPATRSVLVGLRFGVFVWLLSRCPIVQIGRASSRDRVAKSAVA